MVYYYSGHIYSNWKLLTYIVIQVLLWQKHSKNNLIQLTSTHIANACLYFQAHVPIVASQKSSVATSLAKLAPISTDMSMCSILWMTSEISWIPPSEESMPCAKWGENWLQLMDFIHCLWTMYTGAHVFCPKPHLLQKYECTNSEHPFGLHSCQVTTMSSAILSCFTVYLGPAFSSASILVLSDHASSCTLHHLSCSQCNSRLHC